ncbi:MAG TPA: hypothetical protein VNV66_21760 [Pilimelia sp.]|nr:hypothetical protein [Pilimelia sp.]
MENLRVDDAVVAPFTIRTARAPAALRTPPAVHPVVARALAGQTTGRNALEHV